MVRTQVYLTEKEKAELKALSASTGKKQSELIREAIDLLIAASSKNKRDAVFEKAAGMWKTRKIFLISALRVIHGTGIDWMSKPILLDTDIMVDFLRGYPKALRLVEAHADRIMLSSIVVAELYAGVKGTQELEVLDDFISFCRIIPVTESIARTGGMFKNQFSKSHGVGLADALIAATAEAEEVDLKTLNIKHYPMLKGLRSPYNKRK